MNACDDYYRILQVQPDAADAVIRSSYRTLMQTLRLHPDLGGDHTRAALINEAYAVLSDPAKRHSYDAARVLDADIQEPLERESGQVPRSVAPVRRCAFCSSAVNELAACTGEGFWRCPTCRAPGPRAGVEGCTDTGPSLDARSVLRIEHDAPVRFRSRWPQPVAFRGTMEDLSPSGMRFVSEVSVSAGDLLLLDCAVLDALGRVVDARSHGRSCQVRVAFESVALKQRQGGFLETRA